MDATEPAASALPWEGYFHRDAVLFVIDAGMHMHEEVEHETAFISSARPKIMSVLCYGIPMRRG